jgi:hypothetical protein
MKNQALVLEAAKVAREKAEQIAEQELFNEDLEGLCARASAILFSELRKRNIYARICLAYDHCFVVYDNHIVDVTATQFNIQDKIFICKLSDLERISHPAHWEYKKSFRSIKRAVQYQSDRNWPTDQIIQDKPKWRNWQTQRTQNPPTVRS